MGPGQPEESLGIQLHSYVLSGTPCFTELESYMFQIPLSEGF